MASAESPPRLILNDHCQVCEFRQRCHDQAVQEDNISLFGGMGEKEIRKLQQEGHLHHHPAFLHISPAEERQEGQATAATSLLRPPGSGHPRQEDLRAEAPSAPASPVRIYLDIEGDSERSFVYLLGMIVDEGGTETGIHSGQTARTRSKYIFRRMLEIVSRYEDFTLIHYGSYETSFLKRMKKVFGQQSGRHQDAQSHGQSSFHDHSHIYFPLHSNGLKEIGRYLGCTWTDPDASGLKSIVLRSRWEKERDETAEAGVGEVQP